MAAVGGNERANTQLFISGLCALLGVATPVELAFEQVEKTK